MDVNGNSVFAYPTEEHQATRFGVGHYGLKFLVVPADRALNEPICHCQHSTILYTASQHFLLLFPKDNMIIKAEKLNKKNYFLLFVLRRFTVRLRTVFHPGA